MRRRKPRAPTRALTRSERLFLWLFYGVVALGLYLNLLLTVYERTQGGHL